MPPKKKAGAAAKSKATPVKPRATPNKASTRGNSRAAPETFTSHGVEYDTTAAATRPVRRTTAADYRPKAQFYNDSAGASTANTSRKRARAATSSVEDEPPKKRGRPPKTAASDDAAAPRPKNAGGRPAKSAASKTEAVQPVKRSRGRPPKSPRTSTARKALKTTKAPAKSAATSTPSRKRGRPAAASQPPAPAVPPEVQMVTPKKRGRPPKGGETTKINTDDAAAQEQLENELENDAEKTDDEVENAATDKNSLSKRKRSQAAAKGKAFEDYTGNDREETSDSKNYWLMKAEQDGHDVTLEDGTVINTTFTIDDLASKAEPEAWDGVRNLTAAKNVRTMLPGDLAFFYASGGKKGRKPGIVGTMEIVSKPEPDTTCWDPRSAGFVKFEQDRNRWCQVRVEFRKKFAHPLHLSELQKHKNGKLSGLQELNAARLSVSKVTEAEWNFIHSLIEKNEDAANADLEAELEAQISTAEGTTTIEETTTIVSATAQSNGDIIIETETATAQKSPELPNGFAPPAIMSSEAPELPSTDAIFPTSTTDNRPSSRAGSRASSRPASRAGSRAPSSRPASRAGSLARPSGRARSRTPGARAGSVGPTSVNVQDASGLLGSLVEEANEF